MKEVLKLALDALDGLYMPNELERVNKAIIAINEALAKQEQGEPASVTYKEVADTMNCLWNGSIEQVQMAQLLENKKLYTTPPQRKPPEWYAQWIRNNYQDHPNIATLCDEMTKAAHGIKENT
jgi:hypothetical protein